MPEATPAPAAAPAAPAPAPAAAAPTPAAAVPAASSPPTATAAPAPAPQASSPAPAAAGSEAPKTDGLPKDALLGGEEKPPEGEKSPEVKPEAQPLTVESYKDLKFPEGMQADEKLLAPAKELFVKEAITPTQAQALTDFWNAQAPQIVQQAREALFNEWRTTQEQWQAEMKNDPKLGGEKLPGVLAAINSGIRSTMGDHASKFFGALKFTGAANNPDVIRGLEMVLRSRTEGGQVTGNAPTTTAPSFAQRLYGKKDK